MLFDGYYYYPNKLPNSFSFLDYDHDNLSAILFRDVSVFSHLTITELLISTISYTIIHIKINLSNYQIISVYYYPVPTH